MSEEKLSIKQQAVKWAEGLHTNQVVTEELKEDIISEMENIPEIEGAIGLLKECVYVLNMIPNKKYVGKNGESSYDVASKLDAFLREYKAQYES